MKVPRKILDLAGHPLLHRKPLRTGIVLPIAGPSSADLCDHGTKGRRPALEPFFNHFIGNSLFFLDHLKIIVRCLQFYEFFF